MSDGLPIRFVFAATSDTLNSLSPFATISRLEELVPLWIDAMTLHTRSVHQHETTNPVLIEIWGAMF